jgi:hypothetical protein
LSKADQEDPKIELRIGIHSGPVDRLGDVNQRTNIAGAGINMAQRVMDSGDAGHILLSSRVADDLAQYGQWHPYLHPLADVEVKHAVRLPIVNFYSDGVGNPAVPAKIAEQIAKHRHAASLRRRKLISIVAFVAMLVAAIAALLYGRLLRQNALAPTSDKGIAVLPLQNLSGDQKQESIFESCHKSVCIGVESRLLYRPRTLGLIAEMFAHRFPFQQRHIGIYHQSDKLVETGLRFPAQQFLRFTGVSN